MARTHRTRRTPRTTPPQRTPVPTTPIIPELAILREPAVLSIVPISRSTLWDRVAKGLFPPPIRLGPRQVGWRLTDVRAFVEALESTRA